uniref:Uncharacterized protein n=1 Tax=Arion vulgaris TaxID=1028688 RepID=A0A0B7B8P8_9EUPU
MASVVYSIVLDNDIVLKLSPDNGRCDLLFVSDIPVKSFDVVHVCDVKDNDDDKKSNDGKRDVVCIIILSLTSTTVP